MYKRFEPVSVRRNLYNRISYIQCKYFTDIPLELSLGCVNNDVLFRPNKFLYCEYLK